MHLAEYAKEIRYSSIHELMMKRYNDAMDGNEKVAEKNMAEKLSHTPGRRTSLLLHSSLREL